MRIVKSRLAKARELDPETVVPVCAESMCKDGWPVKVNLEKPHHTLKAVILTFVSEGEILFIPFKSV